MEYNLTEAQMRIYATQCMQPTSSLYNIGGIVYINGMPDIGMLIKAISDFIYENDSFSIRITIKDGIPKQYIVDEKPSIDILDFSDSENPYREMENWINQHKKHNFVLHDAPLYQFAIIKLKRQCAYYINIHHIIADGWSIQKLTFDISRLYTQRITGCQPASIECESKFSFIKYIANERKYIASEQYVKDKDYWRARLNSHLDIAVRSEIGSGERFSFSVGAQDTLAIREYCMRTGVTLNAFFIAVYMFFIYKTTRLDKYAVGIPVLGRSGKSERQIFGMFVNTLLVVSNYSDFAHLTVEQILHIIDVDLKKGYAHQKYPFNHLLKDFGVSNTALFNTSINYYNTKMCEEFGGFSAKTIEFYNGEQEYDLQIVIRDWNVQEGLVLDFDYKNKVYTLCDIKFMSQYLQVIYQQIVSINALTIQNIHLLSGRQQKQQYYYNQTDSAWEYPVFFDCFEACVLRTPYAVALRAGQKEVTYQQLYENAVKISAQIYQLKGNRNGPIAIAAENSVQTVAAILGIIKLGWTFLPIDTEWPMERMQYVLNDAGAALLLCTSDIVPALPGMPIVNISNIDTLPFGNGDVISSPIKSYEYPAYILYTSGSTGTPKGVQISYKSISNYIGWAIPTYAIVPQDCFALFSSLTFDLTLTSLFAPLACGASVAIYSHREQNIVKIIEHDICTCIKMTPSHLRLLMGAQLRYNSYKLRTIIVGGEIFKRSLAMETEMTFGGKIEIFNEYGPTEATVGCMNYKYNRKEHKEAPSVPIGRPSPNNRIYIVDRDGCSLGWGLVGEICIAGDQLALGYINNTAQTKEKFVCNNNLKESRIYKTGDYGRFIDSSCIEYVGRMDDQVKINGYRIELSEIENAFTKFCGVNNVVALVRSIKEDTQQVVVFVEGLDQHKEAILKQQAKNWLPSYMVPEIVVVVSNIPLTINGKVDKTNLLQLVDQRNTHIPIKVSGVEVVLVNVVRTIFNDSSLEIKDNFFYIGGDSIKAIQLSSYLHKRGYELSVRDILENPVLQDMAEKMVPQVPAEADQQLVCGSVELVGMVRWFFEQKFHDKNNYYHRVQLKLAAPIDEKYLNFICQKLLLQHDTLRLNWDEEKLVLYYNYCEENKIMQFQLVNTYTNFDITQRPLLYSTVKTSEQGMLWSIYIHHLAIDGVSWLILLDDIDMLLSQYYCGVTNIIMPGKTASYKQWAQKAKATEKIPLQNKACSLPSLAISHTVSINAGDITAKGNKLEEMILAAYYMAVCQSEHVNEAIVEIERHGRDIVAECDITNTVGWFTFIGEIQIKTEKFDINNILGTVARQLEKVVPQYTFAKEQAIRMRYNFLGSFDPYYTNYALIGHIESNMEITVDLEANAYVFDGRLVVEFKARENITPLALLKELSDLFLNNMAVIERTMQQNDMESILSTKEINMLFTDN